ncbi:MAG: YifB family Mg chelatase-like AAA ATPase [Clostridia bacterium]|nr:YifB family Mg chelatase-like AAA ATPase [Clostridia bacterium]
MYSEVFSVTMAGLEAVIVNVETDAGDGLPYFEMSGYLASQVREAKDRVRVAIKNSGIELRPERIVVNISPADVRKAGTGFDLPIAVGILAANGIIDSSNLKNTVVLGELSLDGKVNGVKGVMPSVMAAAERGFTSCIIPACNSNEGSMIDGINVYGVESLRQLIDFLNGNTNMQALTYQGIAVSEHNGYQIDFADIKGQMAAKRASMIAAAGMHNILYVGPPGSGKTMMAKRMPTIMPDLEHDEIMELTKIYSVAGCLNDGVLMNERPFRAPHHSVTRAGLLGGGNVPRPGEITLATKGVLFLDELTEFPQAILESLRQPLEDRKIRIVRATAEYTYPADFMLVAAMNPCKCGYYPDRTRCFCTEHDILRYMGRISQPIWDRFDLNVKVNKVEFSMLSQEEEDNDSQMTSEQMRDFIGRARDIQKDRFKNDNIHFNSQMSSRQVKKYCRLGDREKDIMEKAYCTFNMTARGYEKVLKTARTIADMEGEENIAVSHLSEAISYRNNGIK